MATQTHISHSRLGQARVRATSPARALRAERGASILIALFYFLVCAVVGAVVLTAATVTTGQLVALEKSQQAYYSVTSAAELLRDAIEGGTCTAVGTGEGATWTCALVERADNVTGVEGLNAWLEALVAKVSQDDPQATVASSFDVAFAGASPAVNESVLAVRADVTMRADYSLHVSLRPKDYDEAVGDYRVTLEIPAALLHRDDETTVERIVWERAIIGKPSLLGGAA